MNDKLIDLVKNIINSDLPLGTRNSIVTHYMLPKPGMLKAPLEDTKFEAGTVERPTKEEVDIENNPRLKAEYRDTERLMGEEEDDDDE